MQDIIRPVNSYSMMQVDRNDIWCNMSLPNLFKSDEEKENKQRNERKIEHSM